MVWQGMEEEDIKGQGLQGGVRKGELREEGDGLRMGVDRGGSSPSEEFERCMRVCILGSILTLTTGGVFKVEEEEWRGVRISVDTLKQESGSPYTLYLLAESSHTEDPLSKTLECSHMVNDKREVYYHKSRVRPIWKYFATRT